MKHVKRCGRCGGTGEEQLSRCLSQTLDMVGKDGITADGAARELRRRGVLEITATAMNNRLERLRADGKLTRKPDRRGFRYFKI